MAVALLVFSMTTLWPVGYLYFDVWILLASGLLAYDGSGHAHGTGSSSVASRPSLPRALALVFATAAVRPGSSYSLDIGDPSTTGYTGGGFGQDLAVDDEGRRVVWIEGETARVRLPRAGWTGATIRVAIRPSRGAGRDGTRATRLGGRERPMRWAWPRSPTAGRRSRFAAAGATGATASTCSTCSSRYATAAPDADGRPLSAAIDRVSVE